MITEVAVRLYREPEAIASAMCAVPDDRGAVDAVIETMQRGVPMARIELLDEDPGATRCNRYSADRPPRGATLFIELHGTGARVKEQAESLPEIVGGHGGRGSSGRRVRGARRAVGARDTMRTSRRSTSCRVHARS